MSIFVNFLVAGCGAFFGGGVRKLLSDWLNGDDKPFPVGTFIANAVGSLLIGVLLTMFQTGELTGMMNVFLATGFCGGLTTFSSFASGINRLMFFGSTGLAVVYIVLNMVLGILFVYLGCFFVLGDKLGEIFD